MRARALADDPADDQREAYPLWVSIAALAALGAMVPLAILFGQAVSPWIVPGLMLFFLAFGAIRRVRVYEVLVEGAKEGFQVALRIIPYLVAILVAVGMLRASGAMDVLVGVAGRRHRRRWDCRPRRCPWP